MTEENSKDALLGDPLSSVTRRERRLLLGVSISSIAVAKTGLVPSKIPALGIEFANTDQRLILWIIALIRSLFLMCFLNIRFIRLYRLEKSPTKRAHYESNREIRRGTNL